MVDLGGGQDGPIEHGFSDSVFILPAFVVVSLSGKNADFGYTFWIYMIISLYIYIYPYDRKYVIEII